MHSTTQDEGALVLLRIGKKTTWLSQTTLTYMQLNLKHQAIRALCVGLAVQANLHKQKQFQYSAAKPVSLKQLTSPRSSLPGTFARY